MLKAITRFFVKEAKPRRSPFIEYTVKQTEKRMKDIPANPGVNFIKDDDIVGKIFDYADKNATQNYPS